MAQSPFPVYSLSLFGLVFTRANVNSVDDKLMKKNYVVTNFNIISTNFNIIA